MTEKRKISSIRTIKDLKALIQNKDRIFRSGVLSIEYTLLICKQCNQQLIKNSYIRQGVLFLINIIKSAYMIYYKKSKKTLISIYQIRGYYAT